MKNTKVGKKKKHKKSEEGGFVFSTNPNFGLGDLLNDALEKLTNTGQELEVHLEKKGRGGKTVVVIRGFKGDKEERKELAKRLKEHCGVGGSTKDGEIIIQGDVRKKVMTYLDHHGYKAKRVGG